MFDAFFGWFRKSKYVGDATGIRTKYETGGPWDDGPKTKYEIALEAACKSPNDLKLSDAPRVRCGALVEDEA